jgi:hypothetical protein
MKTKLHEIRERNRQRITEINIAILEVVTFSGISEQVKVTHGPKYGGDWRKGDYARNPLVVLNEFLISVFTSDSRSFYVPTGRKTYNIEKKDFVDNPLSREELLEKGLACTALLEKMMDLLYRFNQLPTLQRRLEVAKEIADFITDQKHWGSYESDLAMSEWLEKLVQRASGNGVFSMANQLEPLARVKVIQSYRKFWKLPFKESPTEKSIREEKEIDAKNEAAGFKHMNREPTPTELRDAGERFDKLIENYEKEEKDKEVKKE